MKKVVIVLALIILILGGVTLIALNKANNTTKDGINLSTKAKQVTSCFDMNSLKSRLYLFMLDNGSYPSTAQGIEALLVNPSVTDYPHYPAKAYLRTFPKDPWDNPFSYTNIDKTVELISYGADGVKGGTAANKDIYLSKCK